MTKMGENLLPIVAKEAGKAATPAVNAAGGTLSEVWQGLVGDKIVAWRIKNAAKAQQKLEKELSERGLKLDRNSVTERYAVTWFDKVSEEDEPEIQELFAKLLANAAEGNEAARDRRNIKLISNFTPATAKLFSEICCVVKKNSEKWGNLNLNFGLYELESTDEVIRQKIGRVLEYEHLLASNLISVQQTLTDHGFGGSDSEQFGAVRTDVFGSEHLVGVKTSLKMTEMGMSLGIALGLLQKINERSKW
ncbi:hypothetical protein [Qipengyuania gelatinilytica]|uniref:DUF4393 domain-containing protein n=1 Tax=Qipengyuania gelatinilytica TaxID=2867231 RepID=A0ABX9A8J5_9SPHN|nr:hypothetical protein [Qipengyuania gelatinilytica]QZD96223.1 hypothetical protein K3136_05905 [Qipengyuania gelatinilytica]